jgi:hypothetical protein
MKKLILLAVLAAVGCKYQTYNSYGECTKPSLGAVTDVSPGNPGGTSGFVSVPDNEAFQTASPTPEKTPDMTIEERALGMQNPLPITNGGVGCPTELWVFNYEKVPLVNAQTGENPTCSYILQNKDGDVMISIVTYPNAN